MIVSVTRSKRLRTSSSCAGELDGNLHLAKAEVVAASASCSCVCGLGGVAKNVGDSLGKGSGRYSGNTL